MQGGRIFPHLTVEENLNFAGINLAKNKLYKRKDVIKAYFDLFKSAKNGRLNLLASYLSGGEQHQLALAMVLMKNPKFLILDEPSAGLSPGSVKKLYEILGKIKDEEKIGILLIEQNVQVANEFSKKLALLEHGMINKTNINFKQIEQTYFNYKNF